MVGRVGPGHVEPVGLGEHRRITVGPGQLHHDQLAGRHRFAGDHGVPVRDSSGALNRGVVAEHLLHGVRPALRLRPEQGELLGVRGQRRHRIPDQVDRRLEAGREQQQRDADQFVRRQPVLRGLGLDQRGEDVVTRVRRRSWSRCPTIQRCSAATSRSAAANWPSRSPTSSSRAPPAPQVRNWRRMDSGAPEHLGDDRRGQQAGVLARSGRPGRRRPARPCDPATRPRSAPPAVPDPAPHAH